LGCVVKRKKQIIREGRANVPKEASPGERFLQGGDLKVGGFRRKLGVWLGGGERGGWGGLLVAKGGKKKKKRDEDKSVNGQVEYSLVRSRNREGERVGWTLLGPLFTPSEIAGETRRGFTGKVN